MRNNKSSGGGMKINQSIGFYRRYHFTFIFLTTLFSLLFICICAWLVEMRVIFQSGLIGFFHILTGLLIGIYITSNVINNFYIIPPLTVQRTDPNLPYNQWKTNFDFNSDHLRQRREYLVFKRGAASTIVIAVIAILLSSIYLYNLFYLLIQTCPNQNHHSPHFIHSSSSSSSNIPNSKTTTTTTESYNKEDYKLDSQSQSSTIELILSYDHTEKDTSYMKKNVLILKYDINTKQIIHKIKDYNPNKDEYDKWYIKNDIYMFNDDNENDNLHHKNITDYKNTSKDISGGHDNNNNDNNTTKQKQEKNISINLEKVNDYNTVENNKGLFCMNKKTSLYSFIENEIERAINLNLNARIERHKFHIDDDHHHNDHSHEESEIEFELFVRKICKNEYVYIILLIVLLLIWNLLSFVIICYNIWLIRN